MIFRDQYARPWPPSQPRQAGERCDLSDLLVDQCACKVHAKKEVDDGDISEELDFR